ncbi:hypothetical protein SUGI_0001470 [Cryptomeria japonica]|uniref:cytochrome P450 77A1-like n=1 Tax=Cryptomeria japonica TaxID=3369 RepID=UPI002408CBF1|nr:cytochrome P450 77A1-like [Cryptomeria japonica]GLJ04695.1 hypothetical protein SUGI_0001470 [Cryptomeria japonica]
MTLDTLLLLLLAALLSLFFLRRRRRRNLPPGPAYWPLLGNISINKTQKIHTTLNDLEAKYGPIFTLRRGKKPFIVLTSIELIREAVVEKGQILCSRPHSSGQTTIGSTPYDPLWRALRKNLATEMLNPARLNPLRSFRWRAMQALIDRLTTEAAQNGGAMYSIEENIRVTVFSILLYMCFSFEMDIDYVREFQSTVVELLHKAKILSTYYDPFPLRKFLQPGKAREIKHVLSRGSELVVSLVHRRR